MKLPDCDCTDSFICRMKGHYTMPDYDDPNDRNELCPHGRIIGDCLSCIDEDRGDREYHSRKEDGYYGWKEYDFS